MATIRCSVEAGSSQAVVRVEGAMTIYEAAQDKQALMDTLALAPELELDLSKVTEMDTAGIQLLVLLKREAARRGGSVRLTGHSPAALEVLDRYDLAGYFGDPVLMSREAG